MSRDLLGFVTMLSDEIKNLGFRLGKTGPIDKKVERQMKQDLLAKFKSQAEELLDNLKYEEAVVCLIAF